MLAVAREATGLGNIFHCLNRLDELELLKGLGPPVVFHTKGQN